MSVSPRTLVVIALAALAPVWVYLVGVAGMPVAALASTICVLLVAWTLYTVFGGEALGPFSFGRNA